ncbi:MAG: histidinol dehydrogenase [Elusimicrobiota bacterium]
MDKKLSSYIAGIIEDVAGKGDAAVISYTAKWDKVKLSPRDFRVSRKALLSAGGMLEPDLKKSIEMAAKNIKRFHAIELSNIKRSWSVVYDGVKTGQNYNPVETAGIYVPGGRFPYPSTVLMTAIPARVAGVKRIIMVTPPGNLSPAVLYAARIAGVDEIYGVNGPAAIAAMAIGTFTIPKVDIIAGPGNAYVNEAKRQVLGWVGIDSLAGPSEVAIIADSSAKPAYIAADILAQLEHDPDARAFLFTNSRVLLNKVSAILKKDGKRFNLRIQFQAKLCSLVKAVESVNRIAPEHLELMVRKPVGYVAAIKNAGAVFVGNNTPTAVGDYWAGPSHVLPTARRARFSSGLSVQTFMKRTSYIECSASVIKKFGKIVEKLASAEGLENHRKSIAARYKK